MDLKLLQEIPPYDWPDDTDQALYKILTGGHKDESERLLAAELAGDYTVINEDLAEVLLGMACGQDESEAIRKKALISLGPALENADIMGFDDLDDILISEELFNKILKSLQKLYMTAGISEDIRRYVLEAAVRAPQPWHKLAVVEAYKNGDERWQRTAVFCMFYIDGFDEQIIAALEHQNPLIHYHAVTAAGNWGVDGAWPHVAALAASEATEKDLRLAAIEALAGIRPQQAAEIFTPLFDHEDEDIVEAVMEAVLHIQGETGYGDDDYFDDDEYDDDDYGYDEEDEDDEDDRPR